MNNGYRLIAKTKSFPSTVTNSDIQTYETHKYKEQRDYIRRIREYPHFEVKLAAEKEKEQQKEDLKMTITNQVFYTN